MKFGSLLAGLLAAQATAIALPSNSQASKEREILTALLENPQYFYPGSFKLLQERSKKLLKRQSIADIASSLFNPGNIAGLFGTLEAMVVSFMPLNSKAPKATVAEKQVVPPQAEWPGSQRVKVRYGPYRIPPTSEKNYDSQLLGVQGMGNTFKLGATKPCEGTCKVLSLIASLEYADGENAENANGAWFHHAVLLNYGPNAKTPNCGSATLENLFMAGNEKSAVYFALPGSSIQSGYLLTPNDTFTLDTQLMNLQDKEKWVWVTITYDYVDNPSKEMKTGRNAWMSLSPWTAGACPSTFENKFGPSNLTTTLQPKKDVFGEHSLPWVADADGFILATGGHMHDGGVDTEIFLNDKRICSSIAEYGSGAGEHGGHADKPEGMPSAAGAPPSNADIPHIKSQSRCTFKDGLPVKKGDSMHIVANYNFIKHAGMRTQKNELDGVMGIVGTLIAY